VWAPNPKTGALEAMPQLKPTCQTDCSDGMVVYTDSPRSIANQKSVMELLLINHPVDCPVCDKAGECYLQDYSHEYGRGQSRFLEEKVKNPKKDIGPDILLYSDRCIMCTRCVRFTREVTGTDELMVDGRGDREMIDVFPGKPLDNPLAGNVVDLCPVGALLDKDFLFQQRVWFLTKTPSIDGLTASGDNLFVEHNDGKVHRIKPRTNMDVNTWWITDEVRKSWRHVHSEGRIRLPRVRGLEAFEPAQAAQAWKAGLAKAQGTLAAAVNAGKRAAIMVSPMLSCEDAFELASWVLALDPRAELAVGPVPVAGQDRTFKGGFTMYAEKAPNARGVRRVLEALGARRGGGAVHDAASFLAAVRAGKVGAAVVTGNYPSDWVTPDMRDACMNLPMVVVDTLENPLTAMAECVLPGATWVEKAGTFENAKGRLQAFLRAIEPVDFARAECQVGADLRAAFAGTRPAAVNPAVVRAAMAKVPGLERFATDVHVPDLSFTQASDMQFAEI
jgi:NADH-quinone oxidoreductase subunit G